MNVNNTFKIHVCNKIQKEKFTNASKVLEALCHTAQRSILAVVDVKRIRNHNTRIHWEP